MTIIAIANQKGGCAKTTTVVNLAGVLCESGLRVLVIDLDPQGNSTTWLGVDMPAYGGSFDLMTKDLSIHDLILPSNSNDIIRVIPASKDLTTLESAVHSIEAVESVLKRKLLTLIPNQFDYVLIDTPPTLGLLTVNALVASSNLLIPVTTHVLSLSGVAQLLEKVEEVRISLNPTLSILGILASRVDLRTRHSRDVHEALLDHFGNLVMNSTIRENVRLAEAPSFGMPITTYDKNGRAAQDFRALSAEVQSRLK